MKLKMTNDFELNGEKFHLSTVDVGNKYETLLTKWVYDDPFGKECRCVEYGSFAEAIVGHNRMLKALGVM